MKGKGYGEERVNTVDLNIWNRMEHSFIMLIHCHFIHDSLEALASSFPARSVLNRACFRMVFDAHLHTGTVLRNCLP